MATRHQVRQAVVSLLYAKDMGNEMDDFKNEFLEEKKIRNAQFKYANELFNGILQNLEKLDEIINEKLSGHKINEIGTIERAILRLGAYEIKFTKTDKPVVINEGIEIAKELCSETTPAFINGVLDKI